MAIIEYIVLLDKGKIYPNITEADNIRQSWIRGGGNPITKVKWEDYRFFKLAEKEGYMNMIGWQEEAPKLKEIARRWWDYSWDHNFQYLKLQYEGGGSPWTIKTEGPFNYYEYNGEIVGDWQV